MMNRKTIICGMVASLVMSNSSILVSAIEKESDFIVPITQVINKKNAIIEEEIPQSKMSATHTSAQSGEGSDKVLDGNSNTLWHTPWDKSAKLPQGITIDLGEKSLVSTIKVSPRKSEINGIITKYEIYAINNGK